MISADILIRIFLKCLNDKTINIQSKTQTDANFIRFLKSLNIKDKQLFADIRQWGAPQVHNLCYTFMPINTIVNVSITKVGRIYGFRRHDTGEYGNFTVHRSKQGNLTYTAVCGDKQNIVDGIRNDYDRTNERLNTFNFR